MSVTLGLTPRYPAASKKRGMARAIEIVAWLKAFSDERASECAAQAPSAAEAFRCQSACYGTVLEALRRP